MKSKIVLMALAAMMVVGIAQANLLPNSGFEDGTGVLPDGWSALQAPAQVIWSNEAHTGSKSIELQYNNPEAILLATDLIPITAGTEYSFTAWLKSNNGAEAVGPNLRLKWLDAGGAAVDGAWGGMSWYAVTAPIEWTEFTAHTMEAPAGAVSVEVAWLYTWKGDQSGGVYIDDVSMVPEPMTLGLLGFGALMLRRRKKA